MPQSVMIRASKHRTTNAAGEKATEASSHHPNNMPVGLTGDSDLTPCECERGWLCVSFVSVWPCDGLARSGCAPPLAR